MGICKFQDIWKTLFSWVLPVPENAHKAKCKYCPGKLIDIKCGSQALKRHEACSIHMKAVTSVAGSNIVAQMHGGTSVEGRKTQNNCSTMRGSKDVFVSKMKTVCNNLVDVEGCSRHQGNLLTKDMIMEFPFVKAVVNFVENLSNFVENKPKVRSILKESSAFLGISRLPDYAETRFLNLYLVIEAIVTQYPVIKKIVDLEKNDNALKNSFKTKDLLVNLDQFVLHLKPVYELTKATQSFRWFIRM